MNDDFDWRADGRGTSRALGAALLAFAALTILLLVGAVLTLLVGFLRAGMDLVGALLIAAAAAAVIWQARGIVRDERARRRGGEPR